MIMIGSDYLTGGQSYSVVVILPAAGQIIWGYYVTGRRSNNIGYYLTCGRPHKIVMLIWPDHTYFM